MQIEGCVAVVTGAGSGIATDVRQHETVQLDTSRK